MISEKKELKGVLEPELTSDEIGPEQLIQNGISFISGLAKTFSDPEATKKLVSTIVKKDDSDGKTYLHIPVESEKTVENVLTLIGNLVKNMG